MISRRLPRAPGYRAYRRALGSTLGITLLIAASATAQTGRGRPPDFAVIHALVLDVRTGRVRPETTVLIDHGVITGVVPDVNGMPVRASRVLDARGRLLTPGLTDVHLHTDLLLTDSTVAGMASRRLVMRPDSIAAYRREFARAFLPYGVTLVRDVGTDEHYLPMLTEWMRRSPGAPDFFASGAYLISPTSGYTPVPFAVVVRDSAAAAAKVREYHDRGLQNIKLYWRLREPEFRGALGEANRLGMNVTAHVDQHVMTVGQALDLGLKHLEHVHTFALSVMSDSEVADFYKQFSTQLPGATPRTPGLFDLLIPEYFNHLGPADLRALALIQKMKRNGASLTPTLHVFAETLGLAYFTSRAWDATESTAGFTPEWRARAVAGYRVMASYVKQMYDAGVRLDLGSDTQDPGKAVLSEMLLLHDAGIPMASVFRIATLSSAEDIGQGRDYGAIEPGKRANLVLFADNPLERPRALLERKVVIKDGVPWTPVR